MYVDIKPSLGHPWDLCVYKSKEEAKTKSRKNRAFFKIVVEPIADAWIYYMYVRPKYRGTGCAKKVLEEMKPNFARICTQIDASSKSSIDFLKSQGFKAEGNNLVWKNPNFQLPSTNQKKEPSILQPNCSLPEISSSKCSNEQKSTTLLDITGKPFTRPE
jgi:hypothetical protein